MIRRFLFLVLFFALILLPFELLAQKTESGTNNAISNVEKLYRSGKLDDAELQALRLLNTPGQLTALEKSDLYRYLASIAIARDDRDRGLELFILALDSNPRLHLDRTYTSPKILSVFNHASLEFKQRERPVKQVDIEALRVYQLRMQAAGKSLLFPGLGQFHKKQRTRGTIYIAATGLSVLGLISSQVILSNRKSEYDDAIRLSDARDKYDSYKSAYHTRNYLAMTVGTLWLTGFIDALITNPSKAENSEFKLDLSPSINGGSGFRLNLTWNISAKP